MAQAYVPIQTVTVGSGGSASIEFTNIPQTYTDLVILSSVRFDQASDNGLYIQFNTDTGSGSTNYNWRYVYGNGSSASSGSNSSTFRGMGGIGNRSNATASTFANSMCYIPNYTGSTNKSVSADAVNENNATTADTMLWASIWNQTSAITNIKLSPSSGNIVQYSTATLYGVGGARASGGTITSDSRYTYHTFTSSGTFTALEKIKGAEALVIAGGGAGGEGYGGGGGAGGLLYSLGITLNAATTYTVTVGAGGAGQGASSRGGSGGNSMFANLTAIGGGGGAGSNGSGAGNGGSGGGANGVYNTGAFGTGTTGQGNDGATGSGSGGGGGGAGAAGSGINGGDGLSTYSAWGFATSTGQNVGGLYWYAGGAGSTGSAIAGKGGGGKGDVTGTANTGGGGGPNANAGGSGLVIIRYPN